jgi:hypothetical protein
MPRKPKTAVLPPVEKTKFVCHCCGKSKSETEFFTSKWSKVWNDTDKKVLFCKDCIQALMDEYTPRYGEKTALIICCALLDVPFYGMLYQSIINNNSFFNVGLYLRQLQMRQHQYKNFSNCITDGELLKTEREVKDEVESKWSKKDKQNMNYAISVVGYDPFDECNLTDSDRRYCFNILAGYCDVDGIRDDGHKIQCVIQITQNQLQVRKLDEMINRELLAPTPDEKRLKELSATKKQLQDSISKLAEDNKLSSAYNDEKGAGKHTLSQKMKDMTADGYEAIKVNMFDIRTSECMKQIADLSNQSIMEQLTLDANDYAEMLKEQRGLIGKLQSESDELSEENRMLKNKIIDLENKKKKSR